MQMDLFMFKFFRDDCVLHHTTDFIDDKICYFSILKTELFLRIKGLIKSVTKKLGIDMGKTAKKKISNFK